MGTFLRQLSMGQLSQGSTQQSGFNHQENLKALWIDSGSIPSCVKTHSPKDAERQLHIGQHLLVENAISSRFDSRCRTGNSFGRAEQAVSFDSIGFLSKLCEQGRLHEAIDAVDRMEKQGMQTSLDIFICLVEECIKKKDALLGKKVQSLIVRSGYQTDIRLECQVIRMFASCGHLHEAYHVFSNLHEQNVFTWTAIILAYAQNGKGEQSLMYYNQMALSGVQPSSHTFVAVVKACTVIAALDQGKLIHADIVKHGVEFDLYVGSTLVNMYAKCGSLEHARRMFDKLLDLDVVSWNAMMAGYAEHGHGQEVLRLSEIMIEKGIKPNNITYVCILKACTGISDLDQGKMIHAEIIQCGLENDLFVCNTLVDMYAKCGKPDDARKVFDNALKRDVVSWNAMIGGYVENGLVLEALQLFNKMKLVSTKPDRVTFVSLLKACACLAALDLGKIIHADIVKRELEEDAFVVSTLVDMYAKCGSLKDAREVFDKSLQRDVVSWSAMIAGYAEHGHGQEALEQFKKMQHAGSKPGNVALTSVLKACGSMAALDQGKLIHADIIKHEPVDDTFVSNALVDMYAKCGSLEDAQKVFERMPQRDSVSWNAMIGGYAEHAHAQRAFELFYKMHVEGIMPNQATFVCILKACAGMVNLDEGKFIHAEAIKCGLESDPFVGSTIIDMYAKCGNLEIAHWVFDKLPERNVVSWSSLISGHAENGNGLEALKLFKLMQEDGIEPNEVTYVCILKACAKVASLDQGKKIHADIIKRSLMSNLFVGNILVDMYCKCGSLEDAHQVFDDLLDQDAVSWSTIIAGYAEHEQGLMAIKMFEQMQQKGIEPNKVTFVAILKASATMGALEHGNSVHAEIVNRGIESELHIGSALVDMYAKCGSLDDAFIVFEDLQERDVVAWSAMIAGYCQHGQCETAQQFFESMQQDGIDPNSITFVSLLSACSHSGLVTEGLHYFESMKEYGIRRTMQHYVCLVDLLGRAGYLDKAEEVVQEMPFDPDSTVWMALLGACAKYKNVELGRRAFDSLIKCDSQNEAGYVLIANIYAANYMWEDVQKLQRMRAQESLKYLGRRLD